MENRVDKFLSNLKNRGNMEEVFDLFPDIIFLIKDRNSKFVFCNEAFLKFFNYRNKEEIYGATDRDILPPSIVDNVNQDDRDVIDNNRRIINRVELIVGGLGHLTWVTTNKLPLIALDGSVSGLMLTIRVLSRADQLPESSQKFRKVIEHIQAHLGENIKIPELARLCFLSDSQFRKRFRAQFRFSPREFILRTRLQVASNMLITTDEPIIEISLKCGFSDQSYFTRQFSKFMGKTPKQYRTYLGHT